MSKICSKCGKGIQFGNQVTHARQELNYRTPKIFKPNLQSYRMPQADGSRKRLLFCTTCLKIVKREVAEKTALKPAAITPVSQS